MPISNDLIRQSGPAADQVIRDDMVEGMATTADTALIRSDGTSGEPKGWRHWAASGNVTATNGTTAMQIETDVREMVALLRSANQRMIRPAWFMSPRSKEFAAFVRDANGERVFPSLETQDRLRGFPVFDTTLIPDTLGGGDESEIYLVDLAQVVIGQNPAVEIMVSQEAAYFDGAAVQSAFSRDQTIVRAIMRHDQVVRYDTAVAIKTGVQWGA